MFTSFLGALAVLAILGLLFGPIVWGIVRKHCFFFTHKWIVTDRGYYEVRYKCEKCGKTKTAW